MTSTIGRSSRKKRYKELGFQSLQQQQWYRKLCLFFKLIKIQSPKNFFQLISTARQGYMARHKNSIPLFNVKYDCVKDSFPPSTIIKWNNLDCNTRNSENLVLFKKRILAFIQPSANITFLSLPHL